jgi:hypothetical protein
MNFRRAIVSVLRILLLAGLAVAYVSAAAGAIGLIDARAVSLIILIGTAVALVATVLYFGVSDLEIRRKFRRELTVR